MYIEILIAFYTRVDITVTYTLMSHLTFMAKSLAATFMKSLLINCVIVLM